jgi:hypothetical protein
LRGVHDQRTIEIALLTRYFAGPRGAKRGVRLGLKIRFPSGSEGSSPSSGTSGETPTFAGVSPA